MLPPIVERDQGHAGGAARLLHVPAPGVRPVRPGPGRADRRATATSACSPSTRSACGRSGSSRPPTRYVFSLRARRRCGRGHRRRAQAARAGREGDGPTRPRGRRVALRRPPEPCSGCAWRAGASAPGARRATRFAEAIPTGGPLEGPEIPGYTSAGPSEPVKVEDRVLGGFGWQREDMKLVQQMAATGAEPIGSLGYDGPLACLSPERQNLADYFKESVAVVTNPAIDREREVEHFSCRAVFGRAARRSTACRRERRTIETAFPVILGGHDGLAPLGDSIYREVAREHKTFLLEDLWEEFRGRAEVLDLSCLESEDTRGRDRAAQARGDHGRARRRRAARALRPHRLRGRPPLPRPAPCAGRRRPRAARALGRAGRDQPAPPLRHRAALGAPSATCTTWCSRSGSAPTASAPT